MKNIHDTFDENNKHSFIFKHRPCTSFFVYAKLGFILNLETYDFESRFFYKIVLNNVINCELVVRV